MLSHAKVEKKIDLMSLDVYRASENMLKNVLVIIMQIWENRSHGNI
jgi:hypothetical protein